MCVSRDRQALVKTTALYLNQAESGFSLLPLIGYLSPTLFALAVIIGEKRYSRLMVVAVMAYALCGVVFGKRMEVGTWLLIVLWHFSTVRCKPIRIGRLLVGFAVVGYAFQWIQMVRDGAQSGSVADHPVIVDFLISQGITFMIPALSWQLSPPPLHTIIGSLLSMRHVYRALGIGSIETANMVDYITAQSSPALFEAGNGLDSSAFLDIFYICGRVIVFYAAACGFLGCLLRKWEEKAFHSNAALFFLCTCLPALFSIQRSGVANITSPIVFISMFMITTYILSAVLTVIETNEFAWKGIRAEN